MSKLSPIAESRLKTWAKSQEDSTSIFLNEYVKEYNAARALIDEVGRAIGVTSALDVPEVTRILQEALSEHLRSTTK